MKPSLRKHFRKTGSEQELRRWFDPLSITYNEDCKSLYVRFPHRYFEEWFATNIKGKFEEQIRHYIGSGCTIQYASNAPNIQSGSGKEQHVFTHPEYPFGLEYTFESFIYNKKNAFPISTAVELIRNRNAEYNPYILYGDNGTGKTHFIKSIANELTKTNGSNSLLFMSIEDIHNMYVSTFSNNYIQARNAIYSHSCLIIDDFHFIKEYTSLQNELIHVFNFFFEKGKQIIISCKDSISSYSFLHQAVKSRLESGLSVYLAKPDLDVRIKYVHHYCKLKSLRLDKSQVVSIAQRFKDIRSIQGILLKLSAFQKLMHTNIKNDDLDNILNFSESPYKKGPTADDIITITANYFHIPLKELRGNKRVQTIVLARQVAMFLCRHLLGCSFPELGKLFGGKDHSTAMYAVKKIEELQEDNKDMKSIVTELKKKCLSVTEE